MKTARSIDAVRKAALKAKGKATEVYTVKLNEIRRDPAFQVRSGLDRSHVASLAGGYKTEADIPPITLAFCGDELLPVIVDGHHRFTARQHIKAETIEAVAVAVSRSEARWLAADANRKHGLPYDREARRELFRTYIGTRRHVLKSGYDQSGQGLEGTSKSYDEIAKDLNITKATIWRWMKKDFPSIAARMGGMEQFSGEGGAVPVLEDRDKELEAVRKTLAKLRREVGDASDYLTKDEMLRLTESMLMALKEQHEAQQWTSDYWKPPRTDAQRLRDEEDAANAF